MNYKELEETYEMGTYTRREIVIVKGNAATLTDSEGKEYIDCVAGVGVASVGNANPKVAEAITKQAKTLITCYGAFYNDKRAEAVKKLVEIAPNNLKKVFLSNSGTEAVEAAIKFSRASTKKTEIIALMRGFHGKTMGSLSATWDKKYQEIFAPLMPGVIHVPSNNREKLEAAITEKTAAVIIELIQGEGGVHPLNQEYVTTVRKLTKEKNVLLIVDEIQTGFCRTGKMFACEHYEIEPDIMCCAKAIAGGVPMGATFCREDITVPKKSHTTTFGGNPLACAASIAAIEFMQENNLAELAAENGAYFMKKLQAIQSEKIREVRGRGLMIGVELKERAGFYVNALMEKGVLALLAGPMVIRFLPPLVITKKQIDIVVKAVEEVLLLESK